ncbi:YggS family pyridoxal phosphate-dependent enzyme [Sphingomonas japonica]
MSHACGIGRGWRARIVLPIAAAMIPDTAQARLDAIQDRIARAATLADRKPESVTLIAVSKTHDADAIRPLLDAGHRVFGENRVQEAAGKWPALREEYPGIALHLIGQLQSNKADEAVALFDAIHSVDRPSLVTALAKAIDRSGRRPDCLIQVNIGDEAQKGGCPVADLPALLAQARAATLPIAGLMCIPPQGVEPAPYFALLAKLSRDHDVAELSMGMSGDFETAVTIGATQVRIGTALFGERPPLEAQA